MLTLITKDEKHVQYKNQNQKKSKSKEIVEHIEKQI